MALFGNKPTQVNIMERHLAIAIAESELKRIRLFIAVLVLGMGVMSFNFFVIQDTTNFFNQDYTQYFILCWFLLFIGYETVGYFIARHFLKQKIIVPAYMKVGNVFIEASFPSLLIFCLCYIEQSVIFLDSPLIFFYFILITLSILNMESRLGLLTGVFSAGQYFIITVWAINAFDAQHKVLNFPPILYMTRSLLMLITALGAVFVTQQIRRRLLASIDLLQEKNKLNLLFNQQVSKEVVDALLTDAPASRMKFASIMFIDIQNFSSFAEKRDPEQIIAFQNSIFNPILKVIDEHKGITNQILGDGLMATFGAPIERADHPEQAFLAGQAILEEVKRLGEKGTIPETVIRIGLHCGEIIMGNIGYHDSISGTPVIIAARLEQLNKELHSQYLISKHLYDQLDKTKYQFENAGELQVKNIEQPVSVYKVM